MGKKFYKKNENSRISVKKREFKRSINVNIILHVNFFVGKFLN